MMLPSKYEYLYIFLTASQGYLVIFDEIKQTGGILPGMQGDLNLSY